jgi:phage shock protein A
MSQENTMSESLFAKLSTQLKGVLHDAMDHAEDPGRTARQLVRDLDVAVGQAEEQMVSVRAEFNLITSKRDGEKSEVDKYANYAVKAVQKGDDELAKEALAEKAKHATQLSAYQAQLDAFAPNMKALEDQIEKLRQRRDEMDRKTDMIEARAATAEATDKASRILGGIGESASASKSFDRLEEKVAKQEAEANARSQMAAAKNGDALKDRFASLDAPTTAVDDELAALKASLGKE